MTNTASQGYDLTKPQIERQFQKRAAVVLGTCPPACAVATIQAAREYKDRCFILNQFLRGNRQGNLTVYRAVEQLEALISSPSHAQKLGASLAARAQGHGKGTKRYENVSDVDTGMTSLPLPVGNTGRKFMGVGL